MPGSHLHRGDIVEVRTHAEILATLDANGMLEGLPFMPEMLPYCGRQFVVQKRADKICETIYSVASRRMPDTVLLDDLRCDGSGHGGCQAACRLFWKDAWLRRVEQAPPSDLDGSGGAFARLRNLVEGSATLANGSPTDPRSALSYRCQATEHFRASQPLRNWDPRPFWREYWSGNVDLRTVAKVALRAAVQEILVKLKLKSWMPVTLPAVASVPLREPGHSLQPGDLVRVKTRQEIASTLSPDGTSLGVWLDNETLPFCGGIFRVRDKVTRLINERTGQMIEQQPGCVTLEHVLCSGEHSLGRWLCPRAVYIQWSEEWLQPMNAAAPTTLAPIAEPPTVGLA